MDLEIDSRFDDLNAFAFEEPFLERSIGLADENLSAFTDHSMPGDALAGGSGGHRAASGARAARETKSSSEPTIR